MNREAELTVRGKTMSLRNRLTDLEHRAAAVEKSFEKIYEQTNALAGAFGEFEDQMREKKMVQRVMDIFAENRFFLRTWVVYSQTFIWQYLDRVQEKCETEAVRYLTLKHLLNHRAHDAYLQTVCDSVAAACGLTPTMLEFLKIIEELFCSQLKFDPPCLTFKEASQHCVVLERLVDDFDIRALLQAVILYEYKLHPPAVDSGDGHTDDDTDGDGFISDDYLT